MSLVKTYPTPVARSVDPFHRMFEKILNREYPMTDLESETTWSPSLDLSETDKQFEVHLEVPGMPRENLDVNVDQSILTVSGHRESSQEDETDRYLWKERKFGRFMRSIRLAKPVKEDKIVATVDDGVLRIVLPKREPAGKSKIVIK